MSIIITTITDTYWTVWRFFRWNDLAHPWRWHKYVKWFFQRATRGYADTDLWNLDGYLAGWLPKALRQFARDMNGWPSYGFNTHEEWAMAVETMAKGFEAHHRNANNDYPAGSDLVVLMRQDEETFKKGAALFIEYFGALWD